MPFKNQHPLYQVFHSMKERCRNKNSKQWKDYGGKGVTVCPRWLEPKIGFKNFLSDMGDRPEGFTLDRIRHDGDYTPSNCRWASRKQQQRNQTVTRKVVISGIEYVAADLADIAGLKTDTIVIRASQGLAYEEIISSDRRVYAEGLSLGGRASGAKKQALTHCKHGHLFDDKNTLTTKEGWRRCRKCHALRAFNKRKTPI